MSVLEMELEASSSSSHLIKIIKVECLMLFQLDLWPVLRCQELHNSVKLNLEHLFVKREIKFLVKLVALLNRHFLLMKMINGLNLLSLMRYFIMKRQRSSLTRKKIGKKRFRLI